MKQIIILFMLVVYTIDGIGQNQRFDNEYKLRTNSGNYYDWKVYVVANAAFLNTVKQVEYYLDPTYKNSTRIIKADPANPNFTLCSNGWGEFTLRIKIVFKNSRTPSSSHVYRLDLHSTAKKKANYRCP